MCAGPGGGGGGASGRPFQRFRSDSDFAHMAGMGGEEDEEAAGGFGGFPGMGGMGGGFPGAGGSRRRAPMEPQKIEVQHSPACLPSLLAPAPESLLHSLPHSLNHSAAALVNRPQPQVCLPACLPALPCLQVPLVLTLEELYTGTTKRRRVTRNILDAASGKAMPVEETLEIPVKAGWKEGTRITFTGGWVLGGWVGVWKGGGAMLRGFLFAARFFGQLAAASLGVWSPHWSYEACRLTAAAPGPLLCRCPCPPARLQERATSCRGGRPRTLCLWSGRRRTQCLSGRGMTWWPA